MKSHGLKIIMLLVAALTGFFILTAESCEVKPSSYDQGQKSLESNMQDIVSAVPVPIIKTAQERKMVAKRALRFDVENKMGYVYLEDNGIILGYYSIIGKVASLRSYLNPVDKVWNPSSSSPVVVENADIDGTYGENVAGIFFFTDNDVYVEWNGQYLYADQPLPIRVPKLNVKITE